MEITNWGPKLKIFKTLGGYMANFWKTLETSGDKVNLTIFLLLLW